MQRVYPILNSPCRACMSKNTRNTLLWLSLLLILALGLSACGEASASNKPVEVKVALTSFKIDSTMTNFKVGVAYHFVVTNNGTVAHEFRIMPPVSETAPPEQVQASTLATIGATDLAPGATQSIDYTFQHPAAPGELEISCHMPGHYAAGMHAPITVDK